MSENGIDIGVLLIRLTLGSMIIAHGANKVFGGGGISGTAGWFESLGLRPGRLHAWAAALTELGAGTLMIVGLAFPATCAAFVGLMVVAALTDHRGKGFFVFKGGWEYVGTVAGIAGAMAFIGPGQWSLDGALNLDMAGPAWGLAATAAGLVAGVIMVFVFRRPVPTTI